MNCCGSGISELLWLLIALKVRVWILGGKVNAYGQTLGIERTQMASNIITMDVEMEPRMLSRPLLNENAGQQENCKKFFLKINNELNSKHVDA